MPLSWNQIRANAINFSREWQDARYEKRDAHSFYNDFFEIFGQRRKNVAVYEEKVQKLNDKNGYIDLFWPGNLIVEQKSAGRDLKKARDQATDYFLALKEEEKPRFILLSDFQTFELLDLEEDEEYYFKLSELPERVKLFAFIAGYQQQKYKDQDPVNIEASELMSDLHKKLEESGYLGRDLELFLVRVMFCLFADDTGIFERDSFLRYIEDHTKSDGSDLGSHVIHLFQVLDTPDDQRQKTLNEDLAIFPYVNGELFSGSIRTPSLDKRMRDALLKCCYFDWSKVSPALFGSLFQTVMLPEEQRQGGAHYTSEKNILKVIHGLFLDELWDEFKPLKKDRSTQKKSRLEKFHKKISNLTFFDPACGCGNFLILGYRELRLLEIEILKEVYPAKIASKVINIDHITKINIHQFYGIEIEEFPAYVAEAAMWLVDHQMNMKLSYEFGQVFVRLPLQKSTKIYHGNALTKNWSDILPVERCSFIFGNPPFVGSKFMSKGQRDDLLRVFNGVKGTGILDYVAAWYGKAAEYIKGSKIKVAFVSTNSICQGEQVGVLWKHLIEKHNIKINFAHRTFKWTIDEKKAKGMRIAAVYVVIIGFSLDASNNKYLFEYDSLVSDPHKVQVNNINPYLVDGPDIIISKRSKPICPVPEISFGNQPIDGGHLILSPEERDEVLENEPEIESFIRLYLGSQELINGGKRYCLWLKDATPHQLRSSKFISNRLELVKNFRLASKREVTRELAKIPSLFGFISHKEDTYIAVPSVSSENREYIPICILNPSIICSNLCLIIPNGTVYHFGVLTSKMHMAWTRYTCGRVKSDYRYSNQIVYNNFPWPTPTDKEKKRIESLAQAILDVRSEYPDSTLADLYNPNTMPPKLYKAHSDLDKAVDKSYSKAKFISEMNRMEFLFGLYQEITEPLVAQGQKKKSREGQRRS